MFDESQIFKWKNSSDPADQERLRKVLNDCIHPQWKTTLLMEGIKSNSDIAAKLLDISVLNVNKNVEGITPLHLAIENNQYAIAKKLLARSADPNAIKSKTKETVLHLIVQKQAPEMVEFLLKSMCCQETFTNIHDNEISEKKMNHSNSSSATTILAFCNKEGQTAGHLAIICENSLGKMTTGDVVSLEMIKIMAQYAENRSMANIFDIYDKNGSFPIHSACTRGNNNANKSILLNWIINQDLKNCNVRKKHGKYRNYTPLMIAISQNNIDCVEVLCSYDNVDICDIKSKVGNCEDHKATEIEVHEANNGDYDHEDVSALYHTIYHQNIEALIILLSTILKRDNVHDWQSLKQSKNVTVEILKSLLQYDKKYRVKTAGGGSICDFINSLIGYLTCNDKNNQDKYVNFVLQLRYDLTSVMNSYVIPDNTIIMHYNLNRYMHINPKQIENNDVQNSAKVNVEMKSDESKDEKIEDIDYTRKTLVGCGIGRWVVHKKILGQGGFGTVHLGIDRKSGRTAALKFIKHEKIKRMKQLVNEIKALQSIHHENVVSLLGFNANIGTKNANFVMLALEHATNGDLFELIARVGYFEIIIVKTFFKQIIHGLKTIHRFNIIHGDLKPQNLLLNGNFQIKISDFGLCKFISADSKYNRLGGGTRGYQSPERMSNGLNIDKSSDMFSIGVILWNMINGIGKNVEPFEKATINDAKYKFIHCGEYNQFWKIHESTRMIKKLEESDLKQLKHLFLVLFNANPQNRYTTEDIYKDEWYQTVADCDDCSLQCYCRAVLTCPQTISSKIERANVCVLFCLIFQVLDAFSQLLMFKYHA